MVGHGILGGLLYFRPAAPYLPVPKPNLTFTVGVVAPKPLPMTQPKPLPTAHKVPVKKPSSPAPHRPAPKKKVPAKQPVQNPKALPKPSPKPSKAKPQSTPASEEKKDAALSAHHIQWIHQRFLQCWRMPLNLSPGCHVDIEVKISPQGTVDTLQVLKSSTQTHPQFSLMRQTVLRALYQAAPYETFLRNRTFRYRFQRG